MHPGAINNECGCMLVIIYSDFLRNPNSSTHTQIFFIHNTSMFGSRESNNDILYINLYDGIPDFGCCLFGLAGASKIGYYYYVVV